VFTSFSVVFVVTILRYQRRRSAAYLDLAEQEALLVEQEKARIAADLHDGMGAMVGALRLQVSTVTARSVKDRRTLERIKGYTDAMMEQLRGLSARMTPRLLEEKGVAAAIADHLDLLASAGSIKVDCNCVIPPGALAPSGEVHLYRVVQEIASNALRHSGALHLTCRIAPAGRVLRVEMGDDGRGFPNGKAARAGAGGLGLKNIMTRALLLQAKVWLDTAEGSGASYVIEIPIRTC
jgi:signal transduction histidine kinase